MSDAELARQHLTWDELACEDESRTPYPERWRSTRLPVLARTFASLRRALGGRPLTVTCGYRTPEHNATVPGSVPDSQHIQGRALDVARPVDMSIRDFHALVRLWSETEPRLGAVGYYANFVHIDTRPRPVATWGRCRA